MSAVPVAPPSPAPAAPGGFWQRRVVRPIRAQLTQGVTPDRIALTLGVGSACSLFPFFGFTTLLNLGIGVALRLNQPILQTLNQLLGPVQLLLILPYVRAGEVLWRATGDRFTVGDILAAFRGQSLSQFLTQFGWAGVHALTAWVLTSPLLIGITYFATRPVLRRAIRRRTP